MPHFKRETAVTEGHIRGMTKDTKSISCLGADQKLGVRKKVDLRGGKKEVRS